MQKQNVVGFHQIWSTNTYAELFTEINLLEAVHFKKHAWSEVHPNVTYNAFPKAGFRQRIDRPHEEIRCEMGEK